MGPCYPCRVPRYLSVFLCSALLLASLTGGCAATQKQGSYGEHAERDFADAMRRFEDDDCLTAEPKFRAVSRNYPFSRFAALSELRTADCLAMQGNHSEAVQAYKTFVRVRPSHPEVPYALYKAAASAYAQVPSEWFLSPPSHERDTRPARDALADLDRFLRDYRTHKLAKDAMKMQEEALTLLARHELYVAHYYLRRDQPKAAVGRIEAMLQNYAESRLAPEAMLLMGRTQLAMRDRKAAHETFRSLMERYPQSGMAEQARRFLKATGG